MASLYRKYRPRTFSELVGQSTVVTALGNAITTGQTVHAYLFTGPRGSGKTSSARLLAKAINCTTRKGPDPCNQCEICRACDESRLLDLIEIDAASNRGIDNMRDIRQQVAYAPSTAKHKVYIIDEAHMLSKEASNAFLKTLEEPPPFVMFILATTEVHKILPTIVSRCQRYDFRKLEFNAASERLRHVAQAEGFSVDDEAMAFIVSRGDGALRDMLGLLEQVASYVPKGQTISRELCLTALGMVGDEAVFELLDAAQTGQAGQVVHLLAQFSRQGVDAAVLTGQLTEHARRLLWLVSGNEALVAGSASAPWLARAKDQASRLGVTGTIALLERLSGATAELRSATLPYFVLELALLRTAGAGDLASRVAQLEHQIEKLTSGSVAPRTTPAPAPQPIAALAPAPLPPAPTPISAPTSAPTSAPAPVLAEPPPAVAPTRSRSRKAAAPAEAPTPPPVSPPPPATPPPLAAVPPPPEPDPVVVAPATEPEFSEEGDPEEAVTPAGGDDVKASWERVMNRMRTDSPRLYGILKEVLAFQRSGKTLKLFVRKGHAFAMDTLRKEPPALMTVLEQELGAKLSLQVSEDSSSASATVAPVDAGEGGHDQPTMTPQSAPPERGWVEKKAVKSKAVQSVVINLDGEIIRVD